MTVEIRLTFHFLKRYLTHAEGALEYKQRYEHEE